MNLRERNRVAMARWRSKPENRAKAAARRKTYRDVENAAIRKRKSTPEGWAKMAILRLRSRAKKSGLPFDLDWRDVLPPERCPVLDIPLVLVQGARDVCRPNSPSVDRRDNSKGYTRDNVRVISNRANLLKKDATPDELRRLLEYVS